MLMSLFIVWKRLCEAQAHMAPARLLILNKCRHAERLRLDEPVLRNHVVVKVTYTNTLLALTCGAEPRSLAGP